MTRRFFSAARFFLGRCVTHFLSTPAPVWGPEISHVRVLEDGQR